MRGLFDDGVETTTNLSFGSALIDHNDPGAIVCCAADFLNEATRDTTITFHPKNEWSPNSPVNEFEAARCHMASIKRELLEPSHTCRKLLFKQPHQSLILNMTDLFRLWIVEQFLQASSRTLER